VTLTVDGPLGGGEDGDDGESSPHPPAAQASTPTTISLAAVEGAIGSSLVGPGAVRRTLRVGGSAGAPGLVCSRIIRPSLERRSAPCYDARRASTVSNRLRPSFALRLDLRLAPGHAAATVELRKLKG
jgi:hypothetical protein